MSEGSEVQQPLMKYARSKGCRVWKVSAESKNDFPDLLILYNSIWLLIECKKKGKSLRPGQSREQKRIRRNGGLAFDTDNIKDGMTIIDTLIKMADSDDEFDF